MVRHALVPAVLLLAAAGCRTAPRTAADVRVTDLDRRYRAIVGHCESFGDGGRIVLEVAYRTLREGKAAGRWPAVGLEDLWVEAIQEGASLFNDPDRRWGKTTAQETKDMIGQTTIGPWQITITNVKTTYGLPYGVRPGWPDEKIYAYCRDRPEIQAKMIADYVQEAYTQFGRRGPYGIQRYFWLEGYVRGWIGQGRWDRSVLPTPPDGDWTKLTPAMKADTGFYAKQVLVGWRGNPRGLLYWLWVTGDTTAIREVLRTWRDQRRMSWDEDTAEAVLTDEPGFFAIHPEDLKYAKAFPECHATLLRIVNDVLAEAQP
jgi:hypothetical protein